VGRVISVHDVPSKYSARVVGVCAGAAWEPTATHDVAFAHETLLSTLSEPRIGLGVTDQSEPVLLSVRTPLPSDPTAWHVSPTQDTESREAMAPRPVGTAWDTHVVPFHCTTQGAEDMPTSLAPTAVQDVVLAQVTPESTVFAPTTEGSVVVVQVVPSNVWATALDTPSSPTAMHQLAVTHETALSSPDPVPAGDSIGPQVEPFHSVAMGAMGGPPSVPPKPTARQNEPPEQLTPASSLRVIPPPPNSFGVGVTDQAPGTVT
jgi:hypothetical protein